MQQVVLLYLSLGRICSSVVVIHTLLYFNLHAGYSSSVSSLTTTTKDKEIEGSKFTGRRLRAISHAHAVPSRSEIKEELLEQCQGSLRKARKLNNTMKKKAYCKGATDLDRIRYSVMLNILKKMQTEAMEEGT